MKNPLLLLLLIIFTPALLTAQHWAPIKMGERYNYRQVPADVITQTLWADSVKVVNGDSVWYMNRALKPCKGCTNGPGRIYHKDQPFFFCRKVRKTGDGHYLFLDPDTLDLRAYASLGSNWTFSTSPPLSATVDSTWETLVFTGIRDSVKRVSLSNGQRIIVSKRNGVLFWGYSGSYSLVGLQGKVAAGEQVPMYADFFKDIYSIGDILEWGRTNESHSSGINYENYAIRGEIVNIDNSSADSIVYTFETKTKSWNQHLTGTCPRQVLTFQRWLSCGPCTTEIKTLKIPKPQANLNHIANAWPGQFVTSTEINGRTRFPSRLAPVILFKNPNGETGKLIGYTRRMCLDTSLMDPSIKSPIFYSFTDFLENVNLIAHSDSTYWATQEGYYQMFYPKQGLHTWHGGIFEYAHGEALLGRIHNGDTTGTILPESYWWPTGLAPEGESLAFSIYPNPAQGRFSIKLPDNQHPAQVRLVNLLGQKQQEWKVPPGIHEGHFELDKAIAPGLYFVEVEQDGKRGSRMLNCAF